MKIERLTPPPPPQPEFRLTVTAEELALIKKLCDQLPRSYADGKRIYAVSDGIYDAIHGDTHRLCVFNDVLVAEDADEALAECARIIAEAN